MITEKIKVQALGQLKIVDAATGEVVLERKNAVHQQNLALVIARALARENNGSIYKLCFGNGGTFLNSSNTLNFRPPNVTGSSNLYNQTYEVVVDDQAVGAPSSNSTIAVLSPPPSTSSLIVVTAVLSAAEPAGQVITDNLNTDPESPYSFDEIALKTQDDLLLTHVIFSPVEKTGNRSFLITYFLTISVA